MSKSVNFITAMQRGKIGSVVFAIVKGQNIARVYQPSVANPQSIGQMFTRKKQTLLVELYRKAASAIKIGFRQTPNPLSEYNGFIKANNPEAMTGTTADDAAIDWGLLKIAKGNMGTTPIDTLSADVSDNAVVVGWDGTLEPVGSSANDLAIVVAVNTTLGTVSAVATTAERNTGTATIVLPEDTVAGNNITCYLAFRSQTSDAVSDSINDAVIAAA